MENFRLSDHLPPASFLRQLVRAFATIPYENLTKIISDEEAGKPGACAAASGAGSF